VGHRLEHGAKDTLAVEDGVGESGVNGQQSSPRTIVRNSTRDDALRATAP
jgi:hypothetical protein